MKMPAMLLRGLVVGALLLGALPGRAESNSCRLINAAVLNALLGGGAVAKPNGGACSWTVAGSPRKLVAAAMKATGPGAEMAYAGGRKNSAQEGTNKVTDEAGIGDKAFAVQTSYGVALFMMKQGRMLQLQYWTGTHGTPKDVEALRPVAKKAIAEF
jgi:hypothetical protein